jgi:hypothetical protein
MMSTFVLAVMLAQHRELRPGPPFSKDPAVRLAYMKDSVTPYRIHRTAAGSPPFQLIAEPIFRLDNPVSQVKDSAIFLWTDPASGRPEATIQMFRAPTGFWIHDWTSLSTSPIVAEVGPRRRYGHSPGGRIPSTRTNRSTTCTTRRSRNNLPGSPRWCRSSSIARGIHEVESMATQP